MNILSRAMVGGGLSLCVAGWCHLPNASAQSAPVRNAIHAWYDSLQSIKSESALAEFDSLSRRGTGESRDLRRSMFRVRSGELRGNRMALELGMDNLLLDIAQHSDWVLPRLLLAQGYFEMERRHYIPLATSGTQSGVPFTESAWREINAALKIDPDYPILNEMVAEMLVPSGDRQLRPDMLKALAVLADRDNPDPDIMLVWGRYLRARGLNDSALAVFTRAMFAGGDRSRLSLERARTFLALELHESASDAYWYGIEHITPIGREFYRNDLEWIISADSIKAFDKVPDGGLEKWIRRFWNSRDAVAAHESGERLTEHLRRWVFAYKYYRTFRPWSRTQFDRVEYGYDQGGICIGAESSIYEHLAKQPMLKGDLRDRELILDHRGVIYLRHGEPTRRIATPAFEGSIAELGLATGTSAEAFQAGELERKFARNESWIYWMEGSWRMLHFMGSAAVGTYGATTLKGFLPLAPNAYAARGIYMSSYMDAAVAIQRNRQPGHEFGPPAGCEPEVQLVIKQSRVDARLSIATDTDMPKIENPWLSTIRSYILGNASENNGKALITFAFGGRGLTFNRTDANHFVYPVKLRVVAYHAPTDVSITVDTVITFVSATELRETGWISGLLELPLPAGEWQLAIYARQDDPKSGAYTLRRSVQIDSVPTLSLSDIVPGRPDAIAWRAPDNEEFRVNPVGVWTGLAEMPVYYEVRGIAEGTRFTTTVHLFKGTELKKAQINITSDGQSTGLRMPVRKVIELKNVDAGSYRLVITIEVNGKKVERSTPVVIGKKP